MFAIQNNCSDIHFYEIKNHAALVYFRISGDLSYFCKLENDDYIKIKQYIKLESSLDLGTSLVPQEGHFDLFLNDRFYDFRVSILPTIHGEDVVCRLFSVVAKYLTMFDLGVSSEAEQLIKDICGFQSGLILITGPTGSGKTTLLYTLLQYLKSQSRGVIITLEDPVEQKLFGVRQMTFQTHLKGFDFFNGLKAILRQDPDIIMLGEIRDSKTAEVALEAAYTGHLVLSSLHTHDIRSTLYRLKQFGCDEFLLKYVLRGIISQKLVFDKVSLAVENRVLRQSVLKFHSNIYDKNIFDFKDLVHLGTYISNMD